MFSEKQSSLWTEAANTATLLENNLTIKCRDLITSQKVFGKGKRSTLNSMQKFGEMCIMMHQDNTHQAKVSNQHIAGIWVGFADVNAVGTIQILNPKT